MKSADLKALLDAADDLLTSQQALLPVPLPDEIRALAQAYLKARSLLLYPRRPARRRSAAQEHKNPRH